MFEYRIIAGVGKDHKGQEIPASTREAALERIKAKAVALFNGYTITAGEGGWVDDNNELVREPCIILHVFVSLKGINTLARFVGTALSQESVCVIEPDGSVAFIRCK